MQLKIQRSQRAGGVMGNTVFFCLDVRADYAPEEQANIRKYKLGGQNIYNSQAARKHLANLDAQLGRTQSNNLREQAAGLARGAVSLAMSKMHLNISIGSLGRGHHIECKDLAELQEAEETVRNACKDITRYLDVAATFNGSETVIEYVNGEEKTSVMEGATPLLTSSAPDTTDGEPTGMAAPNLTPAVDLGQRLSEIWNDPQSRKFIYIGGGIVVLLYFLHSCV